MTRPTCPRPSIPSLFRPVALLVALLAFGASSAGAQLTPERLYYGRDRRMPVVVETPKRFAGEITIELRRRGEARAVETAAAAAGRVDLAALFPGLWRAETPETLYAQLVLDGAPVGPALVLQPMLTPNYAMNMSEQNPMLPVIGKGRVMFEDERVALRHQSGLSDQREREVVYSGIRAYVDRHVILETSEGEIRFRMRPDAAPNTAFNFLHLAEGGLYTDVIFHRVVAALPNGAPFVIQSGDPSGGGFGGPGYFLDLEPTTLRHDFGVLSMARSDDPNSNGSQFFVCLSREGTAHLDGRYTAFGEAISGADVIERIARVEVGENDRPVDPPLILRARVVDAPPLGQEPDRVSRPEAPRVDR
ncbi:MAG: peptidylprolyl isomerase [Phycisphaerales bacterium JB059]